MIPETLDIAQQALREKSQESRSTTARKNARRPRKKKGPRARVSPKTLLTLLAQDKAVNGKERLDAVKLLLRLGGKLPVEESNEPKTEPAPEPAPEPVKW